MQPRKASVHISLALIGAAGLGACGRSEEPRVRHDIYASAQDCQIDWGLAAHCAPFQEPSLSGGGSTTRYFGPWYEEPARVTCPGIFGPVKTLEDGSYQSAGNHAVIGAWVIGGEAAGIGIREDDTPITRDTSRFVPHYFT